MAVAVDSGVWIDYFTEKVTRHTLELDRILDDDVVVVPELVALEVIQGARNDAHAESLERELRSCELVTVSNWSIAILAARNYRQLRSKAVTPRNSVDLLIATWCIEFNIPLLHNDRDYLAMETHLGLRVWRGSEPSPQLA
jgi:predicted nucleic acid-binding protein